MPTDSAPNNGLQAIALPSDGATVAMFGPGQSFSAPIDAFVEPRGATRFGPAQQIVKLGNASTDAQQSNTTTVVDTTRGEVVEAGVDDAESLSTATLASGRTRFVVPRKAPAGLAVYDFPILAADDAGGTFLTGDGCTVGYRPAGGRFRLVYNQSNNPTDCITGPDIIDGIAATGDGYAALLTEGLNQDSGFPDTLSVQVGRFGRFGAPNRLSLDLQSQGSVLGLVTDRDGSVTVAWSGCAAAGCGVYGAQGSVYSGFAALYSGVAGQPALIAAGAPNVRLSGLVADGAVAVQRCAAHRRCTIAVALVRADRQFSQPQAITANGHRLLELKSDDHGDLLLVWSNDRGVLYAATKASGARTVSTPHRLSGSGVNPGTVTAAFGPHGEAIVAWSRSGHTIASVYSTKTP